MAIRVALAQLLLEPVVLRVDGGRAGDARRTCSDVREDVDADEM